MEISECISAMDVFVNNDMGTLHQDAEICPIQKFSKVLMSQIV